MISLRPFSKNDFIFLKQWITGERLCIQWSGPHFRYPLDDVQLGKYLSLVEDNDIPDIGFMAVMKGEDTPVGHIKIGAVDRGAGTAALQFVIIGDNEKRNRGIGSGMVRNAAAYGFEILGLQTLTLKVFDFNISAMACYVKNGFEVTGRYEAEYFINGKSETWSGFEMTLTRSRLKRPESSRQEEP